MTISTWTPVADQMVDIMRETPASELVGVARPEHVRSISPSRAGGGERKFNLWGTAGAKDARHVYWHIADFTLVVDYAEATDHYGQDAVIHGDALVFCRRLSDPANWERATSRIIIIHPSGDEQLPYEVEDLEIGGQSVRRLFIRGTVRYSRVAPS